MSSTDTDLGFEAAVGWTNSAGVMYLVAVLNRSRGVRVGKAARLRSMKKKTKIMQERYSGDDEAANQAISVLGAMKRECGKPPPSQQGYPSDRL